MSYLNEVYVDVYGVSVRFLQKKAVLVSLFLIIIISIICLFICFICLINSKSEEYQTCIMNIIAIFFKK